MKIDDSLASQLPYGGFTPDGEIYLRGRGLTVAYEFRGLPLEASSPAELGAATNRLVKAFCHLGTNDLVQPIFHRLPHLAYPHRDFPSKAARLIDQERRAHFEAEDYWCMLGRLYITTQIESPNSSRVHSAMFGSGKWDPSLNLVFARIRERLANFQDALGGTIELRRLTPEETFRDLILCLTVPRFSRGGAKWAGAFE